ncbi:MAG: hypothetical protein CSA62_05925 [Planctomycetota bacterium]|nr:MAG: hypothetical protein CSA62_05925 [Planctomycetota bacterium]
MTPSKPRVNLYVLTGNSAGEEAVVVDELSIGRLAECDLTLHDQGVSRRHARLVRQGDELFLEDLGSANGTKLKGQRVQKVRLEDGAVFALGPIELRVRIEAPAPSVAAAPLVEPRVAPARVAAKEGPSLDSAVVTPLSGKDDPHRLPSGVLRYSQPKRGGFYADDLAQRGPLQRVGFFLLVLGIGAGLAYLAFKLAS